MPDAAADTVNTSTLTAPEPFSGPLTPISKSGDNHTSQPQPLRQRPRPALGYGIHDLAAGKVSPAVTATHERIRGALA